MGCGRREFLGLFGGILARLALAENPCAVRQDRLYLNRRLNMAFTCPLGWNFVHLNEMGRMQKGQLLAFDDPSLERFVLDSLEFPIVALQPPGDSGAAIQIYLQSPPTDSDVVSDVMKIAFDRPQAVSPELAYSRPMRLIRADWQASRAALRNFRVSKLPADFTLSGCPAAEYTARYDFEHRWVVSSQRVTVRSIVIEHGERFYLLRLLGGEASEAACGEFLNTLRLV